MIAVLNPASTNIAQLVAAELRRRGNKSVKSLFWNSDKGNFSVFITSPTPENPESFNFFPGPDESVEQIADRISELCDRIMNGEKMEKEYADTSGSGTI